MTIKSVIILRADLALSQAKLAVQAAHASDIIHLTIGEITAKEPAPNDLSSGSSCGNLGDVRVFDMAKAKELYSRWICEFARRKVLLAARGGEVELSEIKKILSERRISFGEIWDIGLTELSGPTQTGIVVFPAEEQSLPGKLRHMPLYR